MEIHGAFRIQIDQAPKRIDSKIDPWQPLVFLFSRFPGAPCGVFRVLYLSEIVYLRYFHGLLLSLTAICLARRGNLVMGHYRWGVLGGGLEGGWLSPAFNRTPTAPN